MAFTLPDLPYAHDALAEFGMSAETLEYHHDLHHNADVVNGNKLIAGTEWESKSLEDIITGTYARKYFVHQLHLNRFGGNKTPHLSQQYNQGGLTKNGRFPRHIGTGDHD